MSARIKDVAEKANVSTATVSHVINSTRYVAEETKLKVQQAMRDLDYRPNSVARSLRSRKSNTIGLLVPILNSDTSNFFFMSISQGIQSKLREHGYHLILSNSNEDFEEEKEQIKVFNTQNIDGLIIAPTSDSHDYQHEIGSGYPIIFIDRLPDNYNGDGIIVDGFKGAYDATQHLIDKGHKNVGFISGELDISTSRERFEGYKKALLDNGLQMKDHSVRVGKSSFESGFQFAKEIVEMGDVSALFIANNVMTMGAISYLQKNNIFIPDQLAVIGFDDYDWTKVTNPPLTVIQQPAFELGEKAAEMLIKKIADPSIELGIKRLATKLIERNSS